MKLASSGLLLLLAGCSHAPPLGGAARVVSPPFERGTEFRALDASHGGHWELAVPDGTAVLAVAAGDAEVVRARSAGGGCDPRYRFESQYILLKHPDGTISRYEHIEPFVKAGQRVRAGQRIAVTAANGYQCEPQLGFELQDAQGQVLPTAWAPRN